VYQTTLESLLFALSKEEETSEELSALNINADSETWPPWPWPPWGEDDDDSDEPVNRTRRARKLAKKVIELEKQLAAASLDL
jgi:endothelin-converting enzyme